MPAQTAKHQDKIKTRLKQLIINVFIKEKKKNNFYQTVLFFDYFMIFRGFKVRVFELLP